MDKSNNVAVVKVVMVDEEAEEVGLNAVVDVVAVVVVVAVFELIMGVKAVMDSKAARPLFEEEEQ
jgi:hypothetical protein